MPDPSGPLLHLYLLTRPREHLTWEQAAGFLVAALDESHARAIIDTADPESPWGADNYEPAQPGGPGSEGGGAWLNPDSSQCRLVGTAAPDIQAGLLLRDFRAG